MTSCRAGRGRLAAGGTARSCEVPGAGVLLRRVSGGRRRAAVGGLAPAEGDPAIYLPPLRAVRERCEPRGRARRRAGSTDPPFFTIAALPDGRAVGVASYLRVAAQTAPSRSATSGSARRSSARPRHRGHLPAGAPRLRDLGYRRLEWKCDVLNAASRAAVERLGFTFEGTFRNHVVVKGRNRDTAWSPSPTWNGRRSAGASRRGSRPRIFESGGKQRRRLGDRSPARVVARPYAGASAPSRIAAPPALGRPTLGWGPKRPG